MPRYAELANGQILEFPEETTDEVIDQSVKNFLKEFQNQPDQNIERLDVPFQQNLPSILQQNEASINNAITFDSSYC